MNYLMKVLVPVMGIVIVAVAYQNWGWPGVFAAAGGILMWVLLHFTRLINVLKRAGDAPIGYVGSAVMLNAKLKPGMALLHVIAMTRSIGELHSRKGEQPEVYRWTDGTASRVTCEFMNGKLAKWELWRPAQPADAVADTPVPAPEAAPPAP